jgi:hypothetical protein
MASSPQKPFSQVSIGPKIPKHVIPTAVSSETRLGPFSDVGSPGITASRTHARISVSIFGANPIIPFAPHIDATVDISIRMEDGRPVYSGSAVGDAFPNLEVFIVPPGGNPQMIHTFETPYGPNEGPLIYLPGDNYRPMGTFP